MATKKARTRSISRKRKKNSNDDSDESTTITVVKNGDVTTTVTTKSSTKTSNKSNNKSKKNNVEDRIIESNETSNDDLNEINENDDRIPDYLKTDFKPEKSTISKLNQILNNHDIDIPLKSKKNDYVLLFKENILPRRIDLIRELVYDYGSPPNSFIERTTKNATKSLFSDESEDEFDQNTYKNKRGRSRNRKNIDNYNNDADAEADESELNEENEVDVGNQENKEKDNNSSTSNSTFISPASSFFVSLVPSFLSSKTTSPEEKSSSNNNVNNSFTNRLNNNDNNNNDTFINENNNNNNNNNSPLQNSTPTSYAKKKNNGTPSSGLRSVFYNGNTPRSLAEEGRGSPLRKRADLSTSEDDLSSIESSPNYITKGNPGRTPALKRKKQIPVETPTDDATKIGTSWFNKFKWSKNSYFNSPNSDIITPEKSHLSNLNSNSNSSMRERSISPNRSPNNNLFSPSKVEQFSIFNPGRFLSLRERLGTPVKFANGMRLWFQAIRKTDRNEEGLQKLAESKKPRYFLISDILLLLIFISIIPLIFYADWYIKNNAELSYCRSETDSRLNITYEGYNPLAYYLPTCIKCPSNAVCSKRSVIGCIEENHSLKYPKYMYFINRKLLPFPFDSAYCALDQRSVRRTEIRLHHLKQLLAMVDDDVRDFVGKAECGQISPKYLNDVISRIDGSIVGKPQLKVERDLKKAIGERWKDDFDSIWNEAMKRILLQQQGIILNDQDFPGYESNSTISYENDEVPITVNNQKINATSAERRRRLAIGHIPLRSIMSENQKIRILQSENPPKYSFSCLIRRSIWDIVQTYYYLIIFIGMSCTILIIMIVRRQTLLRDTYILQHLENDVHMKLFEAKEAYRRNPVDSSAGIPIKLLQHFFLPTMYPIKLNKFPGDDQRFLFDDYTSVWYLDPDQKERIWNRLINKIKNTRSDIREYEGIWDGENIPFWELMTMPYFTPVKRKHNENSPGSSNSSNGSPYSPTSPTPYKMKSPIK